MERRAWTRDELLKVLSLYCQIPFGQMHSQNPAVKHLAIQIERSPSAIAFKLVNFASLDPQLQDRGVKGMQHTSQADRAIWDEYYGRWDILADNALQWEHTSIDEEQLPPLTEPTSPPSGSTDVAREVTVRRGQHFFRSAILSAYDNKCCLTGIRCAALLQASHIVPWSRDASLRLDPHNGLCLNALHDAAFDRGLITVSKSLQLEVSTRVKAEMPRRVYEEMFGNLSGIQIAIPERFKPSEQALSFHRENVFRG
jgi:putative restriction endonuclease